MQKKQTLKDGIMKRATSILTYALIFGLWLPAYAGPGTDTLPKMPFADPTQKAIAITL
jgi:hypothetical protein